MFFYSHFLKFDKLSKMEKDVDKILKIIEQQAVTSQNKIKVLALCRQLKDYTQVVVKIFTVPS